MSNVKDKNILLKWGSGILINMVTRFDKVVYNCFFCGNWSTNDAPTWRHLACSLKKRIYWKYSMFTSVFQDWYSPFSQPHLQQKANSPSLRKASFSNCLQNNVMSVHRYLTSFHKKAIVYYWQINIPISVDHTIFQWFYLKLELDLPKCLIVKK